MEIKENFDLKKITTYKVGGNADIAYFPENIEELAKLLSEQKDAVILGGCSNVIISSNGIDSVIITTKLNSYSFDKNILTVECGAKGPVLAKETCEKSLSGFEFMIGFPGTIGGMLCMNSSAHNQAVSDTFISAVVYDRENNTVFELNKKDMQFGYRTSCIARNNYVVLSAKFELKNCDKSKIEELIARNLEFRQLRQPSLSIPNAGSVFKNPENDSAGRLLDLAGAKNLSCGGAKVWENHANFIVNFDNANSADIINLIYKMHMAVKDKYTILLHPEVKFLGRKTREEEDLWNQMIGKNTDSIQI